MRTQKRIKIEVQKKDHRRTCVRDITFLATRLPFLCQFLLLSSSTPSPFPSDVRAEWLNTWYWYGWYSVWLYHEWIAEIMKISCNLRLVGWHLLECDINFRPNFSFSCSGYDLKLIKKSQTKVLNKNKILQTRCW